MSADLIASDPCPQTHASCKAKVHIPEYFQNKLMIFRIIGYAFGMISEETLHTAASSLVNPAAKIDIKNRSSINWKYHLLSMSRHQIVVQVQTPESSFNESLSDITARKSSTATIKSNPLVRRFHATRQKVFVDKKCYIRCRKTFHLF